jgi:hypothetical protein
VSLSSSVVSKLTFSAKSNKVAVLVRGTVELPHHPRMVPPAAPQCEGGSELRGPQSADGRYSTPHNWSSRFRSDVACTAQGCYLFT